MSYYGQATRLIAGGNWAELNSMLREVDATIAAKDAEIAGLRTALDSLLCATEGHDVCPYAKAEARYVLTPETK